MSLVIAAEIAVSDVESVLTLAPHWVVKFWQALRATIGDAKSVDLTALPLGILTSPIGDAATVVYTTFASTSATRPARKALVEAGVARD